MDIIAAIAMAVSGLSLGTILADWRARRILASDLESRRDELKVLLERVQGVHNELVTKVAQVEDRVTAHEFQLSSVKAKPTGFRQV